MHPDYTEKTFASSHLGSQAGRDYNLRNDIIWIKGFTILVIILALRNCWWSIRQYQMGGRWRKRKLPWMMVSRIVIIWPECHCCWVFKKIFHPNIHSYEILPFLFFLSISQLPPRGAGGGPQPGPDHRPLATGDKKPSPGTDRGRFLVQLQARRRRKEQYTLTVSQNVRLLIMVLGENHYDMMSTTIFRRERIEAASFLGYSLKAEGWGLGLSSSTRAQERPQPWLHTRRVQRGQLREAVSQTRHPHQGRASVHVDIWLLHIVRTIIYKQARTNLPMINYVWYQTFSIKFFISTLYYYLNVSFLSLVRSGHEAQIKSVRKTKFRLRSNVTNFPAWQTDFSFGAQL